MQIQGRYSYSSEEGWVKTNKTPLSLQLDYLMAEHFYRMAINKEVNEKPGPPLLTQLAELLNNTNKPFDVRLKRAMRVSKKNHHEISLS
jgi:hypothetical protein